VSLTVLGLIVTAVGTLCRYLAVSVVRVIINIAVGAVVPVAVLVINVVVAVQVRRAASNAAANLGVQHAHHQTSSSNNSAVPTIMLVATSIIYVLLHGTTGILAVVRLLIRASPAVSGGDICRVAAKSFVVAISAANFVFAYNFYVYLITGRQFRAELRKLFSRCLPLSPSSATASPAAAAGNDV